MSMGFLQSSPSSIFCASSSDGTHSLSSSSSPCDDHSVPFYDNCNADINDMDDYDERVVHYFTTGYNPHRRHPHRYQQIDHRHWQPQYECIYSGNKNSYNYSNGTNIILDPLVREEEMWHPWHPTSKPEFGNGRKNLQKSSSNVDYRQSSVRERASDAPRPLKLPPRLDIAEKRRPFLMVRPSTTKTSTSNYMLASSSSSSATSAVAAADYSSSALITRTRSLLGDVYRGMRIRRNEGWSRAPDPKSTTSSSSTMQHNTYNNNNRIVDDDDDPFQRALMVCMNNNEAEEAPPNYYYVEEEEEEWLEDCRCSRNSASSSNASRARNDDHRCRRSAVLLPAALNILDASSSSSSSSSRIAPHVHTSGTSTDGGSAAGNVRVVKHVNMDEEQMNNRRRRLFVHPDPDPHRTSTSSSCLPRRPNYYFHTASAAASDRMVVDVDVGKLKGGDPTSCSCKETASCGRMHMHGDIIIRRRRRTVDDDDNADGPQEFEQVGSRMKLDQRLRRITSAAVVDFTCGARSHTRAPSSNFFRLITTKPS